MDSASLNSPVSDEIEQLLDESSHNEQREDKARSDKSARVRSDAETRQIKEDDQSNVSTGSTESSPLAESQLDEPSVGEMQAANTGGNDQHVADADTNSDGQLKRPTKTSHAPSPVAESQPDEPSISETQAANTGENDPRVAGVNTNSDGQFKRPETTSHAPEHPEFPKNYHGLMWNPRWLRWYVLMGFVILYLACAIALILLWHFSVTENGFKVSASTNHNLWIYSPTAVLTVIISLWQQVNFYGKSLSAWTSMRAGFVDASKSLTVDYVSAIEPLALWKALLNRHWMVPLTIGVSWGLKVAVSACFQ